MIKLNNELAELTHSDLDAVAGGGKIGEATHQTSLLRAASDIGQAAILAPVGELIAKIKQH